MTEAPEGDEFWEPDRVARLLRAWAVLDPVPIALASRSIPCVLDEAMHYPGYVDHVEPWQVAAHLRASLWLGIRTLPIWLTRPVVVLRYIEQVPVWRVAEQLRCSRDTVIREQRLGVVMLSRELGFTGDVSGWLAGRQCSPQVWRKEDK